MNKFAFIALTIFAIIASSTVSADKPKALRRLQTAVPVAVPIAVVAPVAATPTTASSAKGSKRQLVHYNTPYEG